MGTSNTLQRRKKPSRFSWRVIDIVTASVLGVAFGFIYWLWNSVGYAWYMAADILTPGLGGIATGMWLIAGVVGALIIRKPGAAVYTELLAAIVSAAVGNQWGIETLYSGLAQGIGAELIFLFTAYKLFGLWIAGLSGLGAAWLEFCLELFTRANFAKTTLYLVTYFTTMSISGILVAGVGGYYLVKKLAKTGVLQRFVVGREAMEEV